MADLKEVCEALLSTTTVAFNAAAQTTLYTVPIGKTCILTKAIVVAGADAVDAEITIGVTASWDNWIGANGFYGANLDLDELDAAGEYCIIQPHAADPVAAAEVLTRYTAGEIIKVDVTNSGGGATNTIHLFGILQDA
jgi:hypothetical protein